MCKRLVKRQNGCAPGHGPLVHESGQTMVEFALTLMILLLLIFGMIDFGRAVYTASIVQWAAQQGARAGIVDPTTVEAVIDSKLVALDPARATITVTEGSNNMVTVSINYHFEFVAPIVAQIVGNGIDLHGSASMISH